MCNLFCWSAKTALHAGPVPLNSALICCARVADMLPVSVRSKHLSLPERHHLPACGRLLCHTCWTPRLRVRGRAQFVLLMWHWLRCTLSS